MPGCGMRESDISGAQLTFFMHARLLWIRMNKEPEDPSLTWPPACTGIPVQNELIKAPVNSIGPAPQRIKFSSVDAWWYVAPNILGLEPHPHALPPLSFSLSRKVSWHAHTLFPTYSRDLDRARFFFIFFRQSSAVFYRTSSPDIFHICIDCISATTRFIFYYLTNTMVLFRCDKFWV